MSEKDYLIYLTSERIDRFRHLHSLERGQITRFCVQYEAFIDGEWQAIVRYDTAHGRPHKDLITRTAGKTNRSIEDTPPKRC